MGASFLISLLAICSTVYGTSGEIENESNVKLNCTIDGFLPHPTDCRAYYWCSRRRSTRAIILECEEDQIFDTQTQNCTHPSQSTREECGGTYHLSNEVESEEAESSDVKTYARLLRNLDNGCTQEGFMADENDCGKFYRCVGNGGGRFVKYEFSCGTGTVWDPDINACNHPWATRNAKCGGRTDETNQNNPPGGQEPNRPNYPNYPNPGQEQNYPSSEQGQNYPSYPNQEQGQNYPSYPNQEQEQNYPNYPNQGQGQQYPNYPNPDQGQHYPNYPSAEQGQNYPNYPPPNQGQNYPTQEQGQNYPNNPTPGQGQNYPSYPSPDQGQNHPNYPQTDQGQNYPNYPPPEQGQSHPNPEGSNQVPSSPNFPDYPNAQGSSSETPNQPSYPSSNPDQNNENNNAIDNSSDECTQDGFKGDSRDCKKFYRCVDSGNGKFTRYEFSCGQGTVWDQEIQSCNHQWATKNTNCRTEEPGNSPDQTGSSDSNNNYPKPDNTYVPAQESSTSRPNHPEIASTSKPIPDNSYLPPQGPSIPQPSYPENNYIPQEGSTPKPGPDNPNYYPDYNPPSPNYPPDNYNPQLSSTSRPTGSNLQPGGVGPSSPAGQESTRPNEQSTTEQSIVEPTHGSQNDGQSKVECTEDDFIPDPKDCKKFYRCVSNGGKGFTKYEFVCGEGTVWDTDIKSCNHPSQTRNKCGTSESSNIDQSGMGSNGSDEKTTEGSAGSTTSTQKPPVEIEKPSTSSQVTGQFSSTDSSSITSSTSSPEQMHESNQQSTASSTEPNLSSTSASQSTSSGSDTSTQKPEQGGTNKEQFDTCSQDGFIGDSKDCKKFYRCVETEKGTFTRYEFSCGEGTVWDMEQNTCNFPYATRRQCEDEQTDGKEETSDKPDHDKDKESSATESASQTEPSSITSSSSVASSPSAIPSSSIDESSSSTPTPGGKPEESSSDSGKETSSTTSPSPEVGQNQRDDCKSEGFIGDSNDCQKFYRCVSNGRGFTKYQFTCGEGTVWDPDLDTCNYPSSVRNSNCVNSGSGQQEVSTSSQPGEQTEGADVSTTSKPEKGSTEAEKEQMEISTESKSTVSSAGQPAMTTATTELSSEETSTLGSTTEQYASTVSDKTTESEKGTTTSVTSQSETTTGTSDFGPSGQTEGTSEITGSNQSTTTSIETDKESSTPKEKEPTSSTESSQSTPSSETSQSESSTSAPKQDKCTTEGFFPNMKDCTKFYRCVSNGKGFTKYDFNCGPGTIWDPDIDTCNHPWAVSNKKCEQGSGQGGEQGAQGGGQGAQGGGQGGEQGAQGGEQGGQGGEQGAQGGEQGSGQGSEQGAQGSGQGGQGGEQGAQGGEQGSGQGSEQGAQGGGQGGGQGAQGGAQTDRPQSGSGGQGETSQDKCTGEGFYPSRKDCKKFFRCVAHGKGYSKYEFTCGEGTIFDPEIQTCNYPYATENKACGHTGDKEVSATEPSKQSTSSETTSTEDKITSTQETSSTEQTTVDSQQTTETDSQQTTETTSQQTTVTDSQYTTETDGQQTTETASQQTTETENQQTTQSEIQSTRDQNLQQTTSEAQQTTEGEQGTTEAEKEISTTTTSQETTETTTSGSTTEAEQTTVETKTDSTTDGLQTTTISSETTTIQEGTTDSEREPLSTTYSTEQTTVQTEATTTTKDESTTNEGTTTNEPESTSEASTQQPETNQTLAPCLLSELEGDQISLVCPTGFKRHPKYCNLFYQCTNNPDTMEIKILMLSCPSGTIYDDKKIQCLSPEESTQKCEGEIKEMQQFRNIGKRSVLPLEINSQQPFCPNIGTYPLDPSKCLSNFVKCQHAPTEKRTMRAYIHQCPEGYTYWPISKRCEKQSPALGCAVEEQILEGNSKWLIPVEKQNVARNRPIKNR